MEGGGEGDGGARELGGRAVHMTPGGRGRLVEELAGLRGERHRVVEVVSWAAGNGDRSENADYKEGKRRLREIDRRMRFVAGRLADAVVVDPAAQRVRDRVFFGATVTYATERDEVLTVVLVGVDEADLGRGTISVGSPMGVALLGARVGDEVGVRTPRGVERVEVVGIWYPGG